MMERTESQLYRYEITTIAAGTSKDIQLDGEWFAVIFATTNGTVSFDGGPQIPYWPRTLIRHRFKRITIYGNGTQYLTYMIGRGEPPNMQEQRSMVTGHVSLADVSCGAGALTAFYTATANGYRVWVCIPEGSANGLRIGDATVSASRGLYLPVGVPLSLISLAGLYAFNPGGVAVPISINWEKL
jgi:hypothetical protein